MTKRVRVRFAPSPTGPLHIGGVRTALFNYLFAKKHNGDFILRIEDTDQKRYVEGAEEYIIDALNWCNIPYDEGPGKEGDHGPYRQSERKELYRKYADILLEKGAAYYAFDTSEELDAHRMDHEEKGKTFIYNHHNRLKLTNSLVLGEEETKKRIAAGEEYVIRFKSPTDTKIILSDLVRGKMEIDSNVLDDKVLFKSDGMPTYHLANIVDDHLMDISHVIRGEEWLPSMALHQLLYEAFEWEVPQFAHLPLIMKPVGKGKLSKRDGDKLGFPVFPLTWKESIGYRESGYFPETVVNFLALLGWNPGTEQEIFSLEELVNSFDLDRVNRSGARFDPDKTKWYNHQYMQQQSNKELAVAYTTLLENKDVFISEERIALPYVEEVVALIKERATFIHDFWELTSFFFVAPDNYNEKAVKKQWKEETANIMGQLVSILENISDFTAQNVESKVKDWIGDQGLAFGKVMPPLRLITVGDMKGPDMFHILSLIGKEDSIRRINKAIVELK
ncbi:glutamate--tRNA ligase [Arenibacter certesii]|uniref:Glutamate--tRNA ligase n=1 Tax=Arenibacter certesii TaxID=228955 RepID=A0A918J1V9_9FLAO|nr:glutamate--tRNA ligase [Arenibacter certesii]GGW43553.1 glutamate--tRNA ligase [Arenibacter certesii]